MEKVRNIDDAEDFFMRNHSDNLICVNGDKEEETTCYPEAKAFFDR